MRVGLAVVLLSACATYDPLDDIPRREFATTGDAIQAILAESPGVQIYAVGEYHPTAAMQQRQAPLATFSNDIIGLLEPHAHQLVVEAWYDARCGGASPIEAQIQAATSRPPSTATQLAQLVSASRQLRIETHGLPMTCIEHSAMLDPHGRVDFLRLLELVTEKLRDNTERLARQGQAVIVYGGALHNDLYPQWTLEDLSYAQPLAREFTVLELDLVVPEVVASIKMVRREPWFPLLSLASPDRVIVWERGPRSYVLILPAQRAKLAIPTDVM